MLDRILDEIDRMLGGEGRGAARRPREGEAAQAPRAATAAARPSLAERRAELDRSLRAELERQGIVVGGTDVARVVSAAVGKRIEWAG
jgi:hypothetical protein